MADELLTEAGIGSPGNMRVGGYGMTEVLAFTGNPIVTETIYFTNRVWDTLAGPGLVRWITEDASDDGGASYPGPGTFGVHTSEYVIEYTREECLETPGIVPCIGGVGLSPDRTDVSPTIANILCCPFSTDRTDVAGNHTIAAGTSTLATNTGYNNETVLRLERGSGDQIQTGASEDAHAIGGTDPVTFGAFMRAGFYNSTSQFLTSADGSGSANYGLIRFTNGNWAFRGASGGGEGAAWLTMVNRDPEDDAGHRWFHVAMRCDDGANTGAFFWNGTKIWEGTFGTNGRRTAQVTDRFQLNEASSSGTNPQWEGWMSNLFIADRALTDAEIKTLSDQSFGHASPYTPGVV